MTKKMNDWTLLGRVIGQASGWNGEMECYMLYDFEPASNVDLPKGDLEIDIARGLFRGYDVNGNELWSKDIISTLGIAT